MKIKPNMMWRLAFNVAAVACLFAGFAGCFHHVEHAPSLTKAAEAPVGPPEPGFLEKAGDKTWNVVSAPVRWVMPDKRAKAAATQPERFEPANLIIMNPNGTRWEPPTEAKPAASQPK